MNRVNIILTAALGLMLAACSVEGDIGSQKESLYTENITVSANRGGVNVNGPDGTRAVLTGDNTLKSVWEAGDQLTVWTGSLPSLENMAERGFTLESGEGTNSATFTGKVKSTSKPNKNTMLYAVVDRDDDAVDCSSGDNISLDFSVQKGCTAKDVLHYDMLFAESTYADRNFLFHHTMSFVKWSIKIDGITAATTCDITLSSRIMVNKFAVSNDGTLSTVEGDIRLTDVSIDAEGKAVVYVAMFPGTTTTISATVTMADGKVTQGQVGDFDSATFDQGSLYTAAWNFEAPVAPTYTFTATSPAAIAYDATSTGNYSVKSYVTVGSTQQPVAWEVTKYEYSDDGGTTWNDGQPAWFSSLSLTSGEGSTAGENGTATVAAAELVDQNPVNNLLKNAAPKSNYDLSQGGETANCYVISAPGNYKIPLIYGNARNADGSENNACFNNTSPYVNYKGGAITDMWLKTDGTPTSGSLVWKDVTTNIVANLAVSGDFLTFSVPQFAIKQGNAVVAVKDANGDIMWSWHLWFTDSGALSTIAFNNASNETQHFMRDNLGYVIDTYSGTSYVTPRRVRVTVTQAGSNQTATFEIIQNPGASNITSHDTKYQFGRKDAFSGSHVGAPNIGSGKTTYQNSILNPGTFNLYGSGVYDWCSTTYNNGWAVGNRSTANSVSTSAIVKSVYDPCPAGFKMPGSNAFTGFSPRNHTWANNGYIFTDSSNGSSVFFPASGYRETSKGALGNVGYFGIYWSAVPYSANYAWGLSFSSGVGLKIDDFYRAYGLIVRPVQSN